MSAITLHGQCWLQPSTIPAFRFSTSHDPSMSVTTSSLVFQKFLHLSVLSSRWHESGRFYYTVLLGVFHVCESRIKTPLAWQWKPITRLSSHAPCFCSIWKDWVPRKILPRKRIVVYRMKIACNISGFTFITITEKPKAKGLSADAKFGVKRADQNRW